MKMTAVINSQRTISGNDVDETRRSLLRENSAPGVLIGWRPPSEQAMVEDAAVVYGSLGLCSDTALFDNVSMVALVAIRNEEMPLLTIIVK
jgi:hypothetical protein